MTSKSNNSRQKLGRLADKLIEDLYKTSDEEILSEASEDYDDTETAINDVKKVWQNARTAVGKNRLLEAKKSLDRKRRTQTETPKVDIVDIAEARKLLKSIIEQKSELAGQITLAARNLNELTDEDVLSILKDLRELGAINNGDE